MWGCYFFGKVLKYYPRYIYVRIIILKSWRILLDDNNIKNNIFRTDFWNDNFIYTNHSSLFRKNNDSNNISLSLFRDEALKI